MDGITKTVEQAALKNQIKVLANDIEIRMVALEIAGNMVNACLSVVPELSEEAVKTIQAAADAENAKIDKKVTELSALLQQLE